MSGENVTLNGEASVTGDLLVPGTPSIRLNGNPHYSGTVDGTGVATPAGYTVTLNGNASLRNVLRRTDPIPLPAVSPPPSPGGTVNFTINASSQSVTWATARNVTLNGNVGQYVVPAGSYGNLTANASSGFTLGVAGATQPAVYNLQSLTLNGQATLRVVGPVILTLANGFSANGSVGAASNPEWLRLNIAAGDFTINGNANVYGYVVAPSGSVTITGNSQLFGGVMSDRLTLNGNGVLRLIAPPAANRPPTVTLAAPIDGTLFTAPAAINLAATASDGDGSIAKVEFYQGTTKIGEDSSAPYDFTWTGVAAGSYALTAKAYDNSGNTTTSGARSVAVQVTVPYLTGFEISDGHFLGPLAGQAGWAATGSAAVTDAERNGGGQSIVLNNGQPAAQAVQAFAPYTGQSIVFVDFFAKPAAGNTADTSLFLEAESSRVAFVRSDLQGEVHVFDGNGNGGGVWQATGKTLPLAANGRPAGWARLSLRQDFAGKKWDLWVDGTLAAIDLGFATNSASRFSQLTLSGSETAPQFFDDVLVAFDNPVFADADKDGMEDSREIASGLNPAVNDRAGDKDQDGVSNIREFLRGTDPADYYNGTLPVIVSLVADGRAGPQGLIAVKLTRAFDGAALANAPVTFGSTTGNTQISVAPDHASPMPQQRVQTDSQGVARVYVTFVRPATEIIAVTAQSGAQTTSLSINLASPNAAPAVSIISPNQDAMFSAPATISISANATDDGAIAKVEFFAGTTKIGQDVEAPYTITWAAVSVGTYGLTAVATDNLGSATTSASVSIKVIAPNQLPSVALTTPTDGASFAAESTIQVSASASDPDGSIAKVEFFANGTKIGESVPPASYGVAWSASVGGNYTLTAVATDNTGGSTTSQGIAVSVLPPRVELTVPANGTAYAAGSDVRLVATVRDGTFSRVEFFDGGISIGESTVAPYEFTWRAISSGAHVVTARAYTAGGLTVTSPPISVVGTVLYPPLNLSPGVSLTSPAAGTRLTVPVTLGLRAFAGDQDGTISKVEFFADDTKLGEALSAPFTFDWVTGAPGTYSLTAKATDNAGATVVSIPVSVTLESPAEPLLAIDFEPAEGITTGPLNGQNSWQVWQGDVFVATGSNPPSGQHLLSLGAGSEAVLYLDPPIGAATPPDPRSGNPGSSGGVFFANFYAKPAAAEDPYSAARFVVGGAAFALQVVDGGAEICTAGYEDGEFWNFESTGAKVPLDGILSATWHRFTFREDTGQEIWDLYVDGKLVAVNQFLPGAGIDQVRLLGHFDTESRFDNLQIVSDNPLFADADRDGIDDAYEHANGMDATIDDREGDLDGDGLSNIREYRYGTAANRTDTDGDGLPDKWEVENGNDPLVAEPVAVLNSDTDGDGLSWVREIVLGTDPTSADSDGDGMNDGWEVTHGLNPLAPADATADADGDGIADLQEYQQGSDPQDFYNGAHPTITPLLDANGQPGAFNEVRVRVMRSDGSAYVNAPVIFADSSGQTRLSNTQDLKTLGSTAVSRTDAAGYASVYLFYRTFAATSIDASAGSGSQAAQLTIGIVPPMADSDQNGLPDAWETACFGHLGVLADEDSDGDGASNLQEFQNGTNPADFFNGATPIAISLVGPDGALNPDGSIGIRLTNSAGNPLANAPVTLRVVGGRHLLSRFPNSATSTLIKTRTDASGIAKAFVQKAD